MAMNGAFMGKDKAFMVMNAPSTDHDVLIMIHDKTIMYHGEAFLSLEEASFIGDKCRYLREQPVIIRPIEAKIWKSIGQQPTFDFNSYYWKTEYQSKLF
jgi:hypothetical protein